MFHNTVSARALLPLVESVTHACLNLPTARCSNRKSYNGFNAYTYQCHLVGMILMDQYQHSS